MRFPVALRMAMTVTAFVWVFFVCDVIPWHVAYILSGPLGSLGIFGSVAVALALGVTGLARRNPLSELRALSVAWYVLALGWIPLAMAAAALLGPGPRSAGLLIIAIPGLLVAELRARRRLHRAALGS